MPAIGPIKDGVYVARDAIELAGKVSRNSAMVNLIHLAVGGAIAGGVALAQYHLLPKAASEDAKNGVREIEDGRRSLDRIRVMEMTNTAFVVGSAAVVLLTAGMQLAAKGSHLERGLTPMYFLGVGAFGGQELFAKPLRESIEN